MATSKTLTPTNVTISIPEMTDSPNASVFSNCIDKEADAINSLNSNITKTYKDTPNNLTVTTTSGTVQSASVRLFYDKGFANINGRIRIKDCVGRPTITISGIPSECPSINGYGNPTQVRMNGQSQGSIISDISAVAHTKGETTATITFENYIGDFPTATGGYIVTTFNVACC